MIADLLSYLILVGGLVGISLGFYGLLRPTLRRWRSVFPSFQRRESDLRMVEDALSDIDYEALDREAESFRSFFGPKGEAREVTEERPTVPVRPAVRTFKAPAPEPEPNQPRVAALMPPLGTLLDPDGTEIVEDLADLLEEDTTPNVVAAGAAAMDNTVDPLIDPLVDPLADPQADDGLDDLLSLFAETSAESTVPDVIRKAVPDVTIEALLAEAREIRGLLGQSGYKEPAA